MAYHVCYSYSRGTAREPAYSENNLNFRLVGVLQNLTLSEKVFVRRGWTNFEFKFEFEIILLARSSSFYVIFVWSGLTFEAGQQRVVGVYTARF